MFGYAASKAGLDIIKDRPEVYEGRFRGNYLEEAKERLEKDLGSLAAAESTFPEVGTEIFTAGSGESLFGLLYRISEEMGSGLEADLFAVPIRQCAIELCECADINPYLADSEGIEIAVTDDERALESAGGVTIGSLRADRQRFVRIGERVSFLTPEKQTE